MSSTIRTPWPSRSVPQYCTASQIDGRPNPSPAWIVMWKFSRWMYWKASRWRLGGQPASAPAMSNPTTPLSRCRTASSAISSDLAAVRIAVSSAYTLIGRFPLPSAKPARTACTTSSRVRPRSVCSSGAKRTSA